MDTEDMIVEDLEERGDRICDLEERLEERLWRDEITAKQMRVALLEAIMEEESNMIVEWREIADRTRMNRLIEDFHCDCDLHQVRKKAEEEDPDSRDIAEARILLHAMQFPILLPPYLVPQSESSCIVNNYHN